MKSKNLVLSLIILTTGISNISAQKSVSINKSDAEYAIQAKNISSIQSASLQSRIFEANPELQNFSQSNIGDTLLLNFFGDKLYKAIVKQVSKTNDGVTSIAAQIDKQGLAYCYISVKGRQIAVSADIPQSDNYFSIKKINGKNYLLEQKLSEVIEDNFCAAIDAPKTDNTAEAKNSPPQQRTPQISNDAAVTINLLVAFTPSARQWAEANGGIEVQIANAVAAANLAYANSQTGIALNVVHTYEVNYTESGNPNTDLSRLRNTNDDYMDEIHILRRQYNADMVTLLGGDISSSGVTGVAYVLKNDSYGGSPLNAFSVVKISVAAASYTLAHELSHNMGCGHHREIDSNRLYDYSAGWRGTTTQGTKHSSIMSYETNSRYTNEPYVQHSRIPYFSSPNTVIEGTAIGDAATMDNAKTLKQTRQLVSEYANPNGELDYMDNFLKDIQISEGTLSPAFRPEIKQYSVSVNNNVTSIEVTGVPNFVYAKIDGNGVANLQNGENIITLSVQNAWENGSPRIYKINVNRSIITNINENNAGKTTIYQNPATRELKIKNLDLKENNVVQIIDISGKTVVEIIAVAQNSTGETTINVSALPKGIYILKAGNFIEKFTINY
ncbi:MAG: M12 family metallo-peptidase [Prevotellaceae bacterium]|jgi:hypothetical protein|nr:M12 family metallo-peptidase [Prevotellaceae bacterium]